jgi:hypothetical protein
MTMKAAGQERGRSGFVSRRWAFGLGALVAALWYVQSMPEASAARTDAAECPVGHVATIWGTVREVTTEDENWTLDSDDADGTCLVLDVIGYGEMPGNCPAGARFVATGRTAEDEDGFPVLETESIKCNR